ncbi:MAG: class I SAM-dependent methyltransferase [Sedimentisphaerales bacterium]|nr:class I SAM-dependent methyltransferase [Sedimentisphaerales bacterium]
MSKATREYLLQQTFYPDFLGIFINPFYLARKGLARHIAELAVHIQGRTLDIGCGTRPYEKLCRSSEYIGLELDTPDNRKNTTADTFYDGGRFPFDHESFDSIMINQVFEHVFNPEEFLGEVNRVLRREGHVLMTVPFVWDEHDGPCDFARYTSFGMKHLLEKHGFDILVMKKSTDDIGVVFQVLNGYLFKKLHPRNIYMQWILTFFFMAPWTVLGVLLQKITPKNTDLYLDQIILARKARDDEYNK